MESHGPYKNGRAAFVSLSGNRCCGTIRDMLGGEIVRKRFLSGVIAVALCLFFVSLAGHASASALLVGHQESATTLDGPDYDWWYGCSATSAGMMMGYYDQKGYGGLSYKNLVKGGVAESSTYGAGPYLANDAIASQGHIDDFYSGGDGSGGGTHYGVAGDDVDEPWHEFDSLADFMGTSQDAYGNSNGMTTFWNYGDGSRLYAAEIYAAGASYYDSSGMFGMWEYFNYAGYGSGTPENYNFFNQYILGYSSATQGFSFADYMAEIDAGRVVMVHIEGHSMFGYGYDVETGEIIFHDTWNEGEHRMLWGGAYSGMDLYGVTCFTPTGGDDAMVPLPGAVWLLGSGILALVGLRKKSQN